MPIPLCLVALGVVRLMDLDGVYDSVFLLLGLNMFCSLITSLILAGLVGRGVLIRPTAGLLFLGCGILFYGAGGVVGILTGIIKARGNTYDVNLAISVQNLCLWFSALCHLAGALLSRQSELRRCRPELWLSVGYLCTIGFIGLITLAVLRHWTPLFVAEDQRGTMVRMLVLASAVVMFSLTALIFGRQTAKPLSAFIYWYILALLLIATGILGALVCKPPGSGCSWIGRSAQWLGGGYMLIAAFSLLRSSGELRLDATVRDGKYRYLIAIALVAAAAAIRVVFLPVLGVGSPFLTFFPAVTITALYGGARAGFLATVLSGIAVDYFLTMPVGQFAFQGPGEKIYSLMFLASGAVISLASRSIQQTKARALGAEAMAQQFETLKKTKADLHKANEELKSVLGSITDGLGVLDKEWCFTYINEQGARMLGMAPETILGNSVWKLFPLAVGTPFEEGFYRARETGQSVQFEVFYPEPVNRWLQCHCYPSTQYLSVYFHDITERKQAQDLRKREELARNCKIELLSLANASTNTRQFIVGASFLFQKFSGCDALGIRLREGEAHPFNFTLGQCARFHVRRPGKDECANWIAPDGTCVECRHKSSVIIPLGSRGNRIGYLHLKSQKERHFSTESVQLWEELGEKFAIALRRFQAEEKLGKTLEVLEERVAERTEELNRANRALLTLKDCDVVLARATCEGELLDNICLLIAGMDGVKMAWVGFAEQDAAKSIRAAAHAGTNEGFLEKANLTWADGPNGRGPMATAIRTRQIYLCRDIRNDDRPDPLRQEKLARGYAASIALPLILEGECFGALTIYYSLRDALNEREIDLLSRLASDLAYGIHVLRARVDRERLQEELLSISEREKQAIARELHDGLCQHLSGTAMMASLVQRKLAAENSPEAAGVKQIVDLLNSGATEARNLSHGLYPVSPEPEGLMAALNGLAHLTTNMYGIECRFFCNRPVFIPDQIVATHLFRVAQEAINNAMKHGSATEVLITLEESEDSTILFISDNGVGLPSNLPPAKGMGLRIMSHRAAAMGASVEVRPGLGRGTQVVCTLLR